MVRVLWVLALVSGCVTDQTVVCGDLACPVGNVCTANGCATPEAAAACADKVDGETCSTSAFNEGVCAGGACHAVVCGDGLRDPSEACDDGNTIPDDGCSALCDSTEVCGNAVIDLVRGEQCDSGVRGLSGDGCSSSCLSEVARWQEVSPSSIPKRGGHLLAYDSDRDRFVTFGGFSLTGNLDDTWEWDRVRWTRLHPPISPPPTGEYQMVYDPERRRVVLFGGETAVGAISTTWTWNGIEWREMQPTTSPPARGRGGLVYDSIRQKVVLFGGQNFNVTFGDTWEWNGVDWTELHPTTSPPTMSTFGMAYDSARQRVVVFGLGQTWEFDGTTWVNRSPATTPTSDYYGRLAFDPSRQRTILFGGWGPTGLGSSVWEWDGTNWQDRSPPSPVRPVGRSDFGMTYDPLRQRVVLFGGYHSDTSGIGVLGDLWDWDGTTWRFWTPPESSPSSRSYLSAAYNDRHGYALLFGGWYGVFDDTWKWQDDEWTVVNVVVRPPGRSDTALAYDSARDAIVMFGGHGVGGPMADTWTWSTTAATWAQPPSASTTHPSPRDDHAMAFDAKRGRLVLFGGRTNPGQYSNETWEWDGTSWSIKSGLAVSPSSRYALAMAYDARREKIVLFGGRTVGSDPGDTWEWDGTAWKDVTPTSPSPPSRVWGSMTYDPARGRVVLFGGYGLIGGPRADTWEWDGAAWTPVTIASLPEVRVGPAIFYDAIGRRLIAFGGEGFLAEQLADTWALEYTTALEASERCQVSTDDVDGDGLTGCADPDCWGRCAPLCAPGATCSASPHCGDSACDPTEDHLLCPGDCP